MVGVSVTVVKTIDQARAAITGVASVGLVPTMGALHDGHGALLERARAENELVVVSNFVNPLQFDRDEDYQNYPRDLAGDAELVTRYGADVMFAPSVEEMYPILPPMVSVSAGEMGRIFEGASRPGHFDGVCTVVTKLWNILRPEPGTAFRSYFGRKDAQQLAILTRMAEELNIPVEIVPVDLVRAPSGLALSSRNQRLDESGRERARGLSQGLNFLREQAEAGHRLDLDRARELVAAEEQVTLDYLEVVDPATLQPLEDLSAPLATPALALVAAWVPPVRLIDNMMLEPPQRRPRD
ncbi:MULTISPECIES: pantoate--beta-alanine ligase [Auritidibacter]|uniref:pantoate--beta-alanine ligase n=1 Tax=Auritidibacter TaxID=1160973 RepID=UPI000D72CEF6|nr:pantoate--beta-alanine ligase [Auritidibacter ignavus]PXA79030.1 pantoate--beta-alanine ligase [Auritidibacter sp. NML120636]RMX22602.1 pantoate--beta-alanine ligase [Auritidibacter ignavus]